MPQSKSLQEVIKEMHEVPKEGKFYTLTLTADSSKKIVWFSYTHFVGFSEGTPKHELRAPSLVKPAVMASAWLSMGQPGVVVRDENSLFIFLRIGGHALVAENIVKDNLPDMLEPTECAQEGPLKGFTSTESLPDSTLNHAPTPKVRMQVLKRDHTRCKICGRSPATNVDVELQVHHIRPWARGGLTVSGNLITLCHTCHKGLDPHEDHSLFTLVEQTRTLPGLEELRQEYEKGVKNYRQLIAKEWKKALKMQSKQNPNKSPSKNRRNSQG